MALASLLILLLLLPLFILISPSHCLYHKQPSDTTPRDALAAEKTRLGSTPPSCHNKCNQCHPCMAVQVPTIPSQNRVEPSSGRVDPVEYTGSSNRYSNYKPLGWKCRCGGHFYNP